MIKFFRRIRQQLLTENLPNRQAGKFSKYLLYAIGEIVLVVIGILIALGINNWNQENKDLRLGEDLIRRIHRDVVQDTTNFRNIIARNTNLREEIRVMLADLYKGVSSMEQVDSLSTTYDKALDQVFSPNDNTYKSSVSSGTLGLIQNLELKEEIIALYSDYDQKRELLLAINQWMLGLAVTVDRETDFMKFNNFVSDIYTTPEMLNENDFAFLNDKEDRRFKILIRAISATAFNQKVRNAFYEELIVSCNSLLKNLDKEIHAKG